MARIRSIHPGLFTDESYMSASIYARLLLPGLWCEAWDDGVIEWRPLRIKARIFPVDSVDVSELLLELERLDMIKAFEVDGKQYAAIRNFRKWQNPKAPNSSNVLPSYLRTYVGLLDDDDKLPKTGPVQPPIIQNTSGNASAPMGNDFRNASEKSPQKGGREEGRKEEGKERTPPNPQPVAIWPGAAEFDLDPEPDAKPSPPAGRRSVSGDADFERFWQTYPRKVGKGQARKAWQAAIRKAEPQRIISAMEHQRFDPRERFQPHPATWLNGERWLDQAQTGDPVLRAAGLLDPENLEPDPRWGRLQ